MANIVILDGSPRKNGSTAALEAAFTEGAVGAGNEVVRLYLNGMDIKGCLACEACAKNGGQCVQKDDMEKVNEALMRADVVVFASPQFWGTVSGQLKTAVDRLYALQNRLGWGNMKKKCAFLMTARGSLYDHALVFYSVFTDFLGWEDLGTVFGAGRTEEARKLGASIR
ncbi:MAG: flavodoxin family protein [Mailhella sp.]|nr:flavodoxin family protein [Mailhella sp.]